MKMIDNAAGVVAVRHCRSNAVTASVDRIDFHNPAYIGDLLVVKASMNMVGRTSMEIGARVEAERLASGERYHIASAYLTYVSLGSDFKPHKVTPLLPQTDAEKRRHREAQARRKTRLEEKRSEKDCQQALCE
jgi:acyl-CoA hydrolase